MGELVVLVGILHETGRPADSDEQTVRPAYFHFVNTPLPVSQDAARTNDQVINPGSDCTHFMRTDEYPERVVLFRHAPETATRLGQVNLATPPVMMK